jgi:hypothetical protein
MKIRLVQADAARPWLELAGKFDVSSGVVSQSESEAGCMFLSVLDDDGNECGAFSVRIAGGTLWVIQAGGRLPGVSLSEEVMPAVENAARALGCRSVAFATRRAGLIERMEKLGFAPAGTIVRKVLQ